MNIRVAAVVDGLNVYHSIEQAINEGAPARIKWLDIKGLLSSNCLYALGKDAELISVDYFTSLQTWRNDESLSRHKAYIRALESTGAVVHYGQFKEKEVRCKAFNGCGKKFLVSVEKRTDVAIASKLIQLCTANLADNILIFSEDTDLVPAIVTAKTLHPSKVLSTVFPYKRQSYELTGVSKPVFKFTAAHYEKHILPTDIVCKDRKILKIPQAWLQ